MNKYFWRYFLSIFSIAILILGIQTLFLVGQYRTSEKQWNSEIYEEFVSYLEEGGNLEMNGSSFPDDRVSGFTVRNPENGILMDARRPDGIPLPPPEKRSIRETDLNFTTAQDGSVQVTRTEGDVVAEGPGDLYGRINVMLDGVRSYSVDVMLLSPMKYEHSAQIINSCLRSLLISVPVCLVLAFLLAFYISRKNTSDVDKIRKALKKLETGNLEARAELKTHTEIGEIASSVDQLAKSLKASDQSKKAWLNSISHDLNTPAASIGVIAEGLSDGMFPADEKTLYALKRESDNLSERIRRITDYSSLTSETKAEQAEVSSADFARNVIVSCPFADRVTADIFTDKVVCNEALMERACMELLDNAAKASDGQIGLAIAVENKVFSITVSNRGTIPSGMDSADLVQPWTRGDRARTGGGSGLGLAIVAAIAELHNGKVEIRQNNDCVEAVISWPLFTKK